MTSIRRGSVQFKAQPMLTFWGTVVKEDFWTGQGPFEDPVQQSILYGEGTQSGPVSALCAYTDGYANSKSGWQ